MLLPPTIGRPARPPMPLCRRPAVHHAFPKDLCRVSSSPTPRLAALLSPPSSAYGFYSLSPDDTNPPTHCCAVCIIFSYPVSVAHFLPRSLFCINLRTSMANWLLSSSHHQPGWSLPFGSDLATGKEGKTPQEGSMPHSHLFIWYFFAFLLYIPCTIASASILCYEEPEWLEC